MLGLGQASSAPGCSSTKCTKIPRPVSWCVDKNEWYRRCDKCRGGSHAKRDAAVAAAAAALQARKDARELLHCDCCGWQPASEFNVNTKTGKAYTNCRKHHTKMLARHAVHAKTDDGKAANARYKHGAAGKAANQRYREGDTGQATAGRFVAKRQKRRHASAAMRLDGTIAGAAQQLIVGDRETSPTFLERTGWTGDAFRAHVRAACAAQDIDFDDRKSWQLEHKIPREAYNFDDPADVRRCWSAANVHAMTKADNMEKSWKLFDHWIASAGAGCFPAAWQGAPPTEAMKQAHHDKCIAAKALAESADLEDAEEDESSDEECEEADDVAESDDSES